MRLTELNPSWVASGGAGVTNTLTGQPVPQREGVGVMFDCPCGQCGTRCFVYIDPPLDGGPPINGSAHVWQRIGDTFDTLTLSPSILRIGGCGWHGRIKNGDVTPA